MTQYMIIESSVPTPPSIRLQALDFSLDFFVPIVQRYFRSSEGCRLVVDASGRTESLVDDLWEAQCLGLPLEDTPLLRLMERVISKNMSFISWCGAEADELPMVESWADLIAQVRAQTTSQPADLYLHYHHKSRGAQASVM